VLLLLLLLLLLPPPPPPSLVLFAAQRVPRKDANNMSANTTLDSARTSNSGGCIC